MKKVLFFTFLFHSFLHVSFSQGYKPSIYTSEYYTIGQDKVQQGKWTSVIDNNSINTDYPIQPASWTLKKDVSAYPQFQSGIAVSDALYNLSLEEMTNLIEPDSTWRTGQLWGGVWTRDVSYSTLLAMSYMRPDICKMSLLRKTKNGKIIIQDTGTGGSYPVSTDRIVWAIAAWQIYKVTGDKAWLGQAYQIVKNTIAQDESLIVDSNTGLIKGESSFLDWREETYPRWAQPVDIANSECLGTNAIHYEARNIASQMAGLLGEKESALRFRVAAERIKTGINKYLCLPEKGYYSQYLYGRGFLSASTKSETLGEALCIIFGIADSARAKQITASVAQTPFGVSCIYPQIPNIAPYHNNAVWPFVQSYWLWASALTGNSAGVTESIAAIYRAAAMFVTNKENFVAENGDFHTETNSSNMLWSISGNLSIVHRLFFGLQFEVDRLEFHPFIPQAFASAKSLQHFRYRNAILNMEINGYGNKITAFTIDGKKSVSYYVKENLRGTHTIKIQLGGMIPENENINKTANVFSPETPSAHMFTNTTLAWTKILHAATYKILRNGKVIAQVPDKTINGNHFDVPESKGYTEYQVIAVDSAGRESFASEPTRIYAPASEMIVPLSQATSSPAFADIHNLASQYPVEISTSKNTVLDIPVSIATAGKYVLDFNYANGNGTLTDDNISANRTVSVDSKEIGTVVFPQRGLGLWQYHGFSNAHIVELSPGAHHIVLTYDSKNENMNSQSVNQALLHYLRLVRVEQGM